MPNAKGSRPLDVADGVLPWTAPSIFSPHTEKPRIRGKSGVRRLCRDNCSGRRKNKVQQATGRKKNKKWKHVEHVPLQQVLG
jgi:hypothetical protein